MGSKRDPLKIQRKIKFYKLSIEIRDGKVEQGKKRSLSREYRELSLQEIVELFGYINSLDSVMPEINETVNVDEENVQLQGTKYYAYYDFKPPKNTTENQRPPKKYLHMWIDDLKQPNGSIYLVKGKLILSRADALDVWIKKDGSDEPIEPPEDALGLGAATHFILFKDGTLAFEYNPEGAREGKFKLYLKKKLEEHPEIYKARINLIPIPNLERIRELFKSDKINNIRSMLLGVDIELLEENPEILEELERDIENTENAGRVLADLRKISKLTGARRMKLIIFPEDYGIEIEEFYSVATELNEMLQNENQKIITHLRISLPRGEEYDLLNPVVETKISAAKQDMRHKNIVSEDLYDQVISAYKDLFNL